MLPLQPLENARRQGQPFRLRLRLTGIFRQFLKALSGRRTGQNNVHKELDYVILY